MENKIAITDKELADLIRNWMRAEGHKEKAFSRNKVGKVIKDELLRLDHWKNAKRGNPRKAYKSMMNKINE